MVRLISHYSRPRELTVLFQCLSNLHGLLVLNTICRSTLGMLQLIPRKRKIGSPFITLFQSFLIILNDVRELGFEMCQFGLLKEQVLHVQGVVLSEQCKVLILRQECRKLLVALHRCVI